MDIATILSGLSQFFIALFVAVLLLPLERFFPAIANDTKIKGRVSAILFIGLFSAIAILLFVTYGQMSLVTSILSYQIYDLTRAPVPDWALVVIAILIIDFVGYAVHFTSHKLSVLWRIHSVHHSDEHVTAISALLQHPLGALISATAHITVAVLFGLPLLVFVIYAMFAVVHGVITHADVKLPKKLDRALRWIIVTPDLHRTHHSIDMKEGNSNFGVVLTIWDRLFGTYVDEPKTGVAHLVMGLPDTEKPSGFSGMSLFLHPFRKR